VKNLMGVDPPLDYSITPENGAAVVP
jgi:hypothetical protein